MEQNNNETKTTTLMEAIKIGWHHPFSGKNLVYDHEIAAFVAGQVRIYLTISTIGFTIAGIIYNKLANDGLMAIKNKDDQKWYIWNKLSKEWDKPI